MPRIRKHESIESTKEKTWLIGPYIRLSKDDGNDESLSVTNQKKIILDFFDREFNERYVIVDWYIDDGVSGTTGDERPEFQRAIADIKTGRIDCMPCKTLSRAFRNYADQGYYLEQVFPTYNLRFISIGSPKVDTHLDPNAIIDGMELPINGLMNDRYAAKTSQDIRKTFDMKRRKGEFIGAFTPYGYKKNPENKNHLIIDEEVAQVVRDIFQWRGNEEMSKLAITRKLNELGVLNPTAYKQKNGENFKMHHKRNDGMWSARTIDEILKNEMYIGNMVQGKQRVISYKVHKKVQTEKKDWYIVENTHEAIVDRELFEKVQLINKRDTRIAPGNKAVYLFSGFIRCSDCDRAMRRKTSKKKRKDGSVNELVYYTCSTRSTKGVEVCNANTIREDMIHRIVLKVIQAQIALVTNMEHLISEINKQATVKVQSSRLKVQLSEKQQELKKITQTVDFLYMDFRSGDIQKDDYLRMKATFEEKANSVEDVITNIESEIETFSQGVGKDNPYFKTFIKHKNIQTLDRSLLTELVETIYINEKKEITITFKFRDQHHHMVEFIENNQSAPIKTQSS
jgi:DNA invertase Pin-like site-specific DNA recombinase